MTKLKSYDKVQKEKGAVPPKPEVKSGVACTEKKCKGELLYFEPAQSHPEYPKLKRVACGKCGWKGWV